MSPSLAMNCQNSTVTFTDLLNSVRTAIDGGRIGTPVNVRIHWQFKEASPLQASQSAVRIADEALAFEDVVWRVRKDREQTPRMLNLLGEDRRGRTVLVTLCSGDDPDFEMTVFGNLGTLRLEHAGLDEGSLTDHSKLEWAQSLASAIGG